MVLVVLVWVPAEATPCCSTGTGTSTGSTNDTRMLVGGITGIGVHPVELILLVVLVHVNIQVRFVAAVGAEPKRYVWLLWLLLSG